MRFRFLMIAAVAVLTVQSVRAQSIQQPAIAIRPELGETIQDIGTALGITFHYSTPTIVTAEYWGDGTAYAVASGRQGPASQITDYHVSVEYNAPLGMRVDYHRDGQRQIEAVSIDGNTRSYRNYAWNETEPGAQDVTPAFADVSDRWMQYWTMTPHAVLKAIVQAGEAVEVSNGSDSRVLTFPLVNATCRDPEIFRDAAPCEAETHTFTVTLDSQNLIQKVETRSPTGATETTYSDYKDLSEFQSGKLFPARIVQMQDGFTTWDLTIEKADLDYPPVFIRIPDAVRAAAQQRPAGAY